MKENTRISLNDVTLEYPVINPGLRALAKDVGREIPGGKIIFKNNKAKKITSIQSVTLDVKEGERLALLGRNGAGKTTLLRLMAGIYQPTMGSVKTKGSIETLFVPNAGLSQEMTGISNLKRMSMLKGLPSNLIIENRAMIEEFTELGTYLDLPVYTYSAGMKIRLGLAICLLITPDILLFDEVIGAGDMAFIKKARSRLLEAYSKASTIVFSSHAIGIIRELATSVAIMHHGQLVYHGDVDEGFEVYKSIK